MLIDIESNLNSKGEWGRSHKPRLTHDKSVKLTRKTSMDELKKKYEKQNVEMRKLMSTWREVIGRKNEQQREDSSEKVEYTAM